MTDRRADMDLRSLYAGSPRSLSNGTRTKTDQRQRPHAIPDNSYPESMTCSVSTLSSNSASPAPSLDGSRSPVFDTADYSDPSFVSADTMSNTEAALGPHYQHTSEKPIEAKTSQAQLDVQRPQSLGLPLRMHDEGTEPGTKKNSQKVDHPPFDADPSAALTSRIAASILREGYGVRAAKTTVPLKVQDAVERCLQEVSTTVQKEHPPWALPQYRPRDPRPYAGDSDSQSRTSEVASDPEVPANRTRYGVSSGEDEDPFAYDNSKESLYQKLYGFGSGGRGMRARLHEASRPYSCPFRKRNPVMFNVRDHEHCAKRPFFGMQELKHHIRTYHRACGPPHSCPRCKAGFQNSSDLSEHLMVPVEQMCEPNSAAPDNVIEDGITEEMDRALAERTPRHSVKTWEQIWKLLFPQDVSALDSEYLPVVEMVEMEQKLDDSQAELRADLSESLRKLLPEQSEDVCFFLAGQFQLVFEQHRAKVNRKCRISASGGAIPSSASEKSKSDSSRMSRFSMRNFDPATLKAPTIHGRSASQLSSPRSQGRRQSQAQAIPPRTTVSPASTSSSVYSQDPVPPVSNRSRTTTRSSILSMSGMQVESPRLPFKDWVQGVKFSATNSEDKNYQRDSGLAMELCETCQMDPCQCEGYNGYADQLSAFMTPAPNTHQPPSGLAPYSAMEQVSEDEEVDWAAQYGNNSLTPGVPSSGQRLQMKGSRMGLNAQSAQANRLAPTAGQAQQGFI
ncbi:hypothetical protein INS49_009916 [Diaporthe citri]|uniref:uncharacterized protein n=1 Tax=Diaporthe citri TaxID=83186 RepID=UPI001C7EDA90|nr:uncharacterized protein INS49_009916 [Diaporthe citri]KAG6361688.1 hypothetical protein INS49_009916 [Diaporthe citri]